MIKSLLDYCLENGRPELLEQWDTERNGGLMPADVAAGSSVKRYWLCPKGHSFESKPGFRTTRSHGCPYCANRAVLPGFNDLATVRPDLAREWHPDLNGDLTPQSVTAGSSRKAWWICEKGHVWQSRIDLRGGAQRSNCPVCAGNTSKSRVLHCGTICEKSQHRSSNG